MRRAGVAGIEPTSSVLETEALTLKTKLLRDA